MQIFQSSRDFIGNDQSLDPKLLLLGALQIPNPGKATQVGLLILPSLHPIGEGVIKPIQDNEISQGKGTGGGYGSHFDDIGMVDNSQKFGLDGQVNDSGDKAFGFRQQRVG